ncbi:hypothetical protein [Streptomyces sp. CAU 1734]|uniref:hypothetical protein n=1 Tax=Streptomyces sp. CAU 1734 TaxID=3140360 RepID=UPI0032616110
MKQLLTTYRAHIIRTLPPVAGLIAMAATALPAASVFRFVPVALFLLAGPGAAILRVCTPALNRRRAVGPAESWDSGFERDSDRIEQVVIVVLLSMSSAVICATGLIAAEQFSGLRVLALLTVLTMLAACCPQLPAGKHRLPATTAPSRKG